MKWFIAHLSTMTPLGAYLWLFTILLLCGFGLPIPEDISLIAAGYFSWRAKQGHPTPVSTSTWRSPSVSLAVLAGDTIAFFFGRRYGRRVLASNLARRYFTPKRQLRTRAYFRKFGSKVVLVGRFTPGLRFTIFFTAGTLHVRPVGVLHLRLRRGGVLRARAGLRRLGSSASRSTRSSSTRAATEHGILIAIVIVAAVVVDQADAPAQAHRAHGGGGGVAGMAKPSTKAAEGRPQARAQAGPQARAQAARSRATKARRRRESCWRRSARASSTTPIPIRRRRRWPAIR